MTGLFWDHWINWDLHFTDFDGPLIGLINKSLCEFRDSYEIWSLFWDLNDWSQWLIPPHNSISVEANPRANPFFVSLKSSQMYIL